MQKQVTVCKVCSMFSFNGSGAASAADLPWGCHGIAAEGAQEGKVASCAVDYLGKEELMTLYKDFHLHDIDIDMPWQSCIYAIAYAVS